MSKIKCVLTLSSVDDTSGYQLHTHEVDNLEKLHEFLLHSGQRVQSHGFGPPWRRQISRERTGFGGGKSHQIGPANCLNYSHIWSPKFS